MAEQGAHNASVAGSNPATPTNAALGPSPLYKFRALVAWVKGRVHSGQANESIPTAILLAVFVVGQIVPQMIRVVLRKILHDRSILVGQRGCHVAEVTRRDATSDQRAQ